MHHRAVSRHFSSYTYVYSDAPGVPRRRSCFNADGFGRMHAILKPCTQAMAQGGTSALEVEVVTKVVVATFAVQLTFGR